MSLDAIKRVAEAEELARQRITEARAAAEKSIADAEDAGTTSVAQAKAQAEAEIRALMKATEQKAGEFASELKEATANKCAAVKAHAETRLDNAASLIVRRVMEG